jgi:hypothetical protein
MSSSVEIAMALYWRVKTWRMFGSFEAGGGSGTTTVSFDKTFTRQAGSEEELVCTNLSDFDGETYQAAKPLSGDQDIVFNVPGFLNPFTAKARLRIPSIIASPLPTGVALANHFDGEDTIFSWIEYRIMPAGGGDISQGSTNQASGATATEYPLTLLGQTFQLPTFRTNTISISIEAAEYWSYGGTYDTSTGLPL